MKLKVNRKNVTVFEGAEVRHAVLSYLALKGMDVRLADSDMIKINIPKPKDQ